MKNTNKSIEGIFKIIDILLAHMNRVEVYYYTTIYSNFGIEQQKDIAAKLYCSEQSLSMNISTYNKIYNFIMENLHEFEKTMKIDFNLDDIIHLMTVKTENIHKLYTFIELLFSLYDLIKKKNTKQYLKYCEYKTIKSFCKTDLEFGRVKRFRKFLHSFFDNCAIILKINTSYLFEIFR